MGKQNHTDGLEIAGGKKRRGMECFREQLRVLLRNGWTANGAFRWRCSWMLHGPANTSLTVPSPFPYSYRILSLCVWFIHLTLQCPPSLLWNILNCKNPLNLLLSIRECSGLCARVCESGVCVCLCVCAFHLWVFIFTAWVCMRVWNWKAVNKVITGLNRAPAHDSLLSKAVIDATVYRIHTHIIRRFWMFRPLSFDVSSKQL